MTRKPEACPQCGSSNIASILYGLPEFDAQLQKALDDGLVVLGGCSLIGNDPKWHCTDCEHEFGILTLGETNE